MKRIFSLLLISLSFSGFSSNAALRIPPSPKSPSVRADPQPEAKPTKQKTLADNIVDNMSGTVALTSNYMFRGLTQTENLPAIQGGFTYTSPWNFYAALWASNNKFLDTDINLEVDPGIGFYKEITDDFNVDLSFYRYYFPSDRMWNYNEWLGQVNFKFLQSNLGYTNNIYNLKRTGFYIDGGINYTFPSHYLAGIENINALFGRYTLPEDFPDEAGISYNTYYIALSKTFKNYNFAVQYSNTTERDFYSWYGGEHFFCTLTATF
ncbi:hypothetical protein Lbir_1108 [Legionella birminghamensis]|uniref:Bacterial protein of uncharacterized function (Gcw_chp) n=1 Tax=Legionella birminghamensis TaxID=28083 RepID=A0A378IAV4_9GAMM|nr:TorF family putative porin [Legionella birminghamensis]KTC73056.1 hypothetical protein Lbir_1108 [Legionella birminghamensis]STX32367.1 Bacterial protein of uncharacterised function (Gcw_chp) [Legionella birminghamensis]